MSEIEIREVEREEDFLKIADIQRAVWGFDPIDVAPQHLIMVHRHLGGVALGAFDGDKIVGFTYSFFGLREGRPIHWSHMLAVLPEYRGLGLGKRLKWGQRDLLLAGGVELCLWTFDPLETSNARLNIRTLGAIVNEYEVNAYGESSGHLHVGLPTDRFVARWEVTSERAVRCAAGEPFRVPPQAVSAVLVADEVGGRLAPGEPDLGKKEEFLGGPVPTGIQGLKTSDPELAMRWRLVTRELFCSYFERGYRLVDVLSPDEWGGTLFLYVLQRSVP